MFLFYRSVKPNTPVDWSGSERVRFYKRGVSELGLVKG